MNKFIFSILCIIFLSLASPSLAANIVLPNPLCPGGSGSSGCIENFSGLITQITTYIVEIIAGLVILALVFAGILFVTSGGNPGQISKAKQVLVYAIIGAAVALAGSGLIVVIKAIIGAPAGP